MSLNSFDRQLWYREGAKPSLLSLTPTPSLTLSLSLFHSWRAIEYGDRLFSIGSVLLIVCPDNPCRKLWRHSQERPRVASFPSVEDIISSSPVNLQPLTLEYLIERAWWGRDRSWMALGHPRPCGRTPERRWFLPRTRGEGVSRDTLCGRPDKRLCLTTFRLTGHKNRRILCTLADFLRTNYCLPQAVNLKGNN